MDIRTKKGMKGQKSFNEENIKSVENCAIQYEIEGNIENTSIEGLHIPIIDRNIKNMWNRIQDRK